MQLSLIIGLPEFTFNSFMKRYNVTEIMTRESHTILSFIKITKLDIPFLFPFLNSSFLSPFLSLFESTHSLLITFLVPYNSILVLLGALFRSLP